MGKFILHPEMDQDSTPYWQHLREHNAQLQRCEKCGRLRFPPMPSCPYCGTLGGNWVPISGKGTVYSWIAVHHPIDPRLASETPFVLALVDLEEGPRIAGRLLNCENEKVESGMHVKALYDDVDNELTLLNFEPATS
jgi:uncharacterized OB-fold protein